MPSTFSFDVGTPYTYLAAERVGRVGRTSRCDRSSLRLLSLPMQPSSARGAGSGPSSPSRWAARRGSERADAARSRTALRRQTRESARRVRALLSASCRIRV